MQYDTINELEWHPSRQLSAWQKTQHMHLQKPLNVHKKCKAMASQKITIMHTFVSAVYGLLFQKYGELGKVASLTFASNTQKQSQSNW